VYYFLKVAKQYYSEFVEKAVIIPHFSVKLVEYRIIKHSMCCIDEVTVGHRLAKSH